jgi:hypothetical protein
MFETAEDRASFFAEGEFALIATYTPVGGGAVRDITGNFDNSFLEVEGAEASVARRAPRFRCASSSLDGEGRVNDQLVINTISYRVTVPRPDGHGTTLLWLEKI